VAAAAEMPPQGACGSLIASGRTAKSEIDAPGVKRFERAELLGNHQRRVIWKHDPAGADPNIFSLTGDKGDDDRGRSTGNTEHIMMLRPCVGQDQHCSGTPALR